MDGLPSFLPIIAILQTERQIWLSTLTGVGISSFTGRYKRLSYAWPGQGMDG